MGRVTFAQSLSDARLMADAVKAHEEELLKNGMPSDTVEVLTNCINDLSAMDTQQEKLKADLKSLTSRLNSKSAELSQVMTSAKQRVKLVFDKEQWKEFGISATR